MVNSGVEHERFYAVSRDIGETKAAPLTIRRLGQALERS
jgi:hypothetical protein